jgi:uncharacterized protein involved in exopolysaccharide biosynthesis
MTPSAGRKTLTGEPRPRDVPEGVPMSADRDDRSDYTIHDLWAVLMRWRRLMGVTFLAVLIPGLLVTFLMPPLYQATARILVSRKDSTPDYALKTAPPEAASVHRTLDRAEEVNSYGEILKSRQIVEASVDALGVDAKALDKIHDFRRYVRAIYRGVKNGVVWLYDETKYLLHLARRPTPEEQALFDRTALIDEAVDRIRIDPVPDSAILEVGFRSSDPVLARDLINDVTKRFVAHNASLQMARARTFFSEQATKMAADLAAAEKELEQLRAESSTYSTDEQRKLLLSFLAETENKQRAAQAEQASLEARIAELEKQLAREPERLVTRTSVDRNPEVDALKERLVRLRMQRTQLAESFRPDSDTMKRMDSQIQNAESLLARSGATAGGAQTVEVNPIRMEARSALVQARSDLAAAAAQAKSLAEMADSYRRDLTRLGEMALRIGELERTTKAQEEAYLLYIRNQEQARVTEGMAGAQMVEVHIVDAAPLPLRALRPRRLLYSSIALAAAILLALAAPFFAEFNDTTLSSEAQVRKLLGVPVIASFEPLPSGAGANAHGRGPA